jgi:hypothetical protein
MAQLVAAETTRPEPRTEMRSVDALKAPEKSVKILAKSLFRELRTNGFDDRQIVALSTELLSLLTVEIRDVDAR